MWWKKRIPQDRLIQAINNLSRKVKTLEAANRQLQEQMAALQPSRDRMEDIEARLSRLESSDFALNKKQFDQTMRDLAAGNPGVQMAPT